MQCKRILVVEDDRDIRDTLRSLLELEGYEVAAAENGREGLEALDQARPGLVLLDLMMPVMNGWEFLDARRNRTDWSRIPVIVLSATQDPALRDREPISFLRKPVNLDSLLDIVKSHCG